MTAMDTIGELSTALVSIEWKISNFSEIVKNMTDSSKLFSPSFLLNNKLFAVQLCQYFEIKEFLSFSVCEIPGMHALVQEVCKIGIQRKDGSIHKFCSFYGGTYYFDTSKYEFVDEDGISNALFIVEFGPGHKITLNEPYVRSNPCETGPISTLPRESNATEKAGMDELLKSLKDMYLKELFSDVTIHVGERHFRAHKSVLSSRSPVFAAMLQHDMVEKSSDSVNVIDCDPKIFHEFLLYIYSGKVEKFSDENVTGLYTVADKYDIQPLKDSCVDYMKENMSIDMFCGVVQLAGSHNEEELLNISKEFFTKNAYKILITENWLSLLENNASLGNELFLLVVPRP